MTLSLVHQSGLLKIGHILYRFTKPTSLFDKIKPNSSAGSIFDISKYRDTCECSILILMVSLYFDIFGIERPLFDTFNTFDTFDTLDILTSSPFDDVDAKTQHRCR